MARRPNLRMLSSFFAALCLASTGWAKEGPRVGLALSGSPARGFAHIGVLKVLEEVGMPVDVVTGTSMGSVIGGLYACGYSATELESLAVNQDWLQIITQDVRRRTMSMEQKRFDERYLATMGLEGFKIRLPSGLRSGQSLVSLFTRLTAPYHDIEDFQKLPIPFACVAADLVTGDAVVLDRGYLPEAIRASMAIPSLFTPVKSNGHLLTDGGVVRNLPAVDARNLGADVVIGVDVGSPPHAEKDLNTLFNILSQAALLHVRSVTREQRAQCDVVITPDLSGLSVTDFDKASEFITQGERAAREMWPTLKALADSLHQLSDAPKKVLRPASDHFDIQHMSIEGLNDVSSRLVETEMGIKYPGRVPLDDIEKGVERVFGSGYFERVTYRIGDQSRDRTLRVMVIEKNEDLFRIGLRYDSRTEASLLLNATFRNVAEHGSTLAIDLRLAEDLQFETRYFVHTGLFRSLGLLTRVNSARATFDVFADDERVARYRSRYSFADARLGTIFSTTLSIAAGIRAEYIDSEPVIGGPGFPQRVDKQIPFFGNVLIDTYDETIYPSRGFFVELSGEISTSKFGDVPSFSRYYVDGRAVLPLAGRLSLLFKLYYGASGGDIPQSYEFFVGGVHTPWTYLGRENTFVGLKPQERVGPNVQALSLGIQYELFSNIFAQLRWSAGNTFVERDIRLTESRYLSGGGLTLGTRILRGRIEYTVMTSELHGILSHLTIGSAF